VAGIELADRVPPQLLREAGNRTHIWWCREQMHVIVHQHAGVQAAAGCQKRLPQQMEMACTVGLIEEARKAIVAALNDVLRNAGKVEARLTGHRSSVGFPSLPQYRTVLAFLAGNPPTSAGSEPDRVLLSPRSRNLRPVVGPYAVPTNRMSTVP
jgi:hypothetical protein